MASLASNFLRKTLGREGNVCVRSSRILLGHNITRNKNDRPDSRDTNLSTKSLTSESNRERKERGKDGLKPVVRPTKFQKIMLVKAGFYHDIEDIPEIVSKSKMTKAQDSMRVRMSLGIAFLGILSLYGMVKYGKRMRDKGFSLGNEELAKMAYLQEQGKQERDRK